MHDQNPPLLRNLLRRSLASSPLFKGLDDALLDAIVMAGQQVSWSKKHEADAAYFTEHFLVIVQGRLEAGRLDPNTNKPFTLFVLGPGDGYDIVPLLDGRLHDNRAVALDDMLLLSLPVNRVRQWLADYPQMNSNFLHYAVSCLRHMENLATDLALHDTLKRLANLILRHVDPLHDTGTCPYPVHLIHDLKHEKLARMIGSVRQVVNQHLQKLKQSGALEHNARNLFVRDLELLKSYAEGLEKKTKHS